MTRGGVPAKRPAPLIEELLFETCQPTLPLASGRGPTLLGRLQARTPMKKSGAACSAAETPSSSTFGCRMTPIMSTLSGAPIRWPFTPMSTPSPGARLDDIQALHLGAESTNPVSYPELASSARSPFATAEAVDGGQVEPRAFGTVALGVAACAELGAAAALAAPVRGAHDAAVEPASDDGEELDDTPEGQLVSNGPPPPPGALHPSRGSAGHVTGSCRRCCFFPRGRCMNGYDCSFCHYEHDKPRRRHRSRREAPKPPTAHALGGGVVFMQQPLFRHVLQVSSGLCCAVQPAPMVFALPQWSAPQQQQLFLF